MINVILKNDKYHIKKFGIVKFLFLLSTQKILEKLGSYGP